MEVEEDKKITYFIHMEIRVLFFGVLSEVAGTDLRHYSDVKSTEDLKHRILDEYPEFEHYNYRISLNDELITGDRQLNEEDEVALLPPFAGG